MTYQIYNTDCLEYMKTLPDNSVDCILTDPPYGLLDHKIETNIDLEVFFNESYRILKDNSFLVYFGVQPYMTNWNVKAFEKFNYKNEVIWYKKDASPLQDMQRVIENIMIVSKGKKQFNDIKQDFFERNLSLAEFIKTDTLNRYQSKIETILKNSLQIENIIKDRLGEDLYLDRKHKLNECSNLSESLKFMPQYIKDYKTITEGFKASNLVGIRGHNKQQFGKDEFNIKHPTVKPIKLIEWLVELTTEENNIVFDPFMGSGTTGIACLQTKRQFIGCEIHKEYFDIAEARIKEAKTRTKPEIAQEINLNKTQLTFLE